MSPTAGGQLEGVQLLLPASYDVLWSVLALAHLALLSSALVVWFRARHDRGGGVTDLLAVLLIPVIGPAAYLLGHHLAGRRRPRRARSPGAWRRPSDVTRAE